jgi:hypothetical protein
LRPEQRPRGRFNANRPFKQQPRYPQNNQTFDSNGPNVKVRGSAHQIFERYVTLAREATAIGDRIAAENFYQHAEHYLREATAIGDRIAAENFYQHAEHYLRIDNARREGNRQETRPTTPADIEMNSSEAASSEVEAHHFQRRWDGDDSVPSETSTH